MERYPLLNILYRGVAHYVLGDGSTVMFWEDLWSSQILADSLPRLFSFALDTQLSVKNIVDSVDLADIFALPLSAEAHEEFLSLQQFLTTIPYDVESRINGHSSSQTIPTQPSASKVLPTLEFRHQQNFP